MSKTIATPLLVLNCLIAVACVARAEPLKITVQAPAAATDDFHMGASTAPNGSTLSIDSASLVLDGHPWSAVMGEFHYTRVPRGEWREELLRMKAGGITIVSTYVFWIHHEEIEGVWNWSGDHDLREFVRIAGSVGLKVIVRCGPWCHGEVRNGGFPDWLLSKGWKLRTIDPAYLAKVRLLYAQIHAQISSELWKAGGPVVGIQLDNEYEGPADYMMALKKIALEEGLDVPLYTRTGWTKVTTPMPFGEIVPLYGAYAEGFWSRDLTSMPGNFWNAFRFSGLRFDDNIASEELGKRDVKDAPDVARYPYLTCEIGGGMMNSYHRRILIDPRDVESTTLVKLGSGSTLPGYYMYQGGINPEAALTTLMEAQGTRMTNYNDLPVKNYDFQGPLGSFGQIRPQYHLLRRLHLFLADFGEGFARMGTSMPDVRPGAKGDTQTLRWAVRSDGKRGYVFVNNYERPLGMPAKPAVQFSLSLPGAVVTFPSSPVDVPANSIFFWPFNMDLGHGVSLGYATAQPICSADEAGSRTVFFAETKGVPAMFSVAGESAARTAQVGRSAAFSLKGSDGVQVRVVVLSEADSLALWKGSFMGRDRVFLTPAGLTIDGDDLALTSSKTDELEKVGVYPSLEGVSNSGTDGIFTDYAPTPSAESPLETRFEQIRPAGPARDIPLGKISEPVATEPTDADFSQAAVWKISIPKDADLASDPVLQIRYQGDVARITLNGRLLEDDFYNGRPVELGLRRYAPEILGGDLEIAVLPLRRDALDGAGKRIFLDPSAVPEFGSAPSLAKLLSITALPRYTVHVQAGR